jgi:hypothetical protein
LAQAVQAAQLLLLMVLKAVVQYLEASHLRAVVLAAVLTLLQMVAVVVQAVVLLIALLAVLFLHQVKVMLAVMDLAIPLVVAEALAR